MNENEVIHSSLIRPIAKLLVPKNNSQFPLIVDPDSNNWNDFKGDFKERKLHFTMISYFLETLV